VKQRNDLVSADPAVQDRIWDYYQNDAAETFAGSVSRLSFLAMRIGVPGKVLDIGVGSGVFEEMALARGLDVYALDPSERSIAALREKLKLDGKAKIGYSTEIPFASNFFDAVVVSEVLEHLSDDVLARSLPEIERVLVPGGLLLGTVPARERIADQNVVCPDCGSRFHRWGHMQSFDVARMSALLAQHFDIERIFEKRFVTWRTLNWKGKTVALLQLLVSALGVKGSNQNVVFLARKRCA
jgi:SAM-dependent methyltransferase